jgi:hypothetical protein
VGQTYTDLVATKLGTGHVWKPEEALDTLAEIGPMLRELGAELAWHGPSRWRGTGPELVLTVWPRSAGGPSLSHEDVADALQVLGWHPLPVSDSGAERLYADRAGRRLRISHQLA